MIKEDLIFALDIGTRTVIGVVGTRQGENFEIIGIETVEHENRAMVDGQVHDIEEVAHAAIRVKEALEKRFDIKLDRVAIAAAGRALRTKEVRVERALDSTKEIDRDVVNSIEMQGVQAAQAQIDDEISIEEDTVYYCVGYTVTNYYLNNYIISSLIGHKGKTIGADILATFLPHTVIDSLYSVMSRAGLKVEGLTLEPIAAINAAIPRNIRMLNLVLVDIGAGTSDIAITQKGSVVAYAMVPTAGDEITECICQNYLLDFHTAERVKIAVSLGENEINFSDILGINHTVGADEIISLIKPAVKSLGDTITEKIIEYNKKSPSAVFLVGGGSQVFGLGEIISENLELPIERVAVRKGDSLQNVTVENRGAMGPEFITPIGIALNAAAQEGQDFLYAKVNGKKVRLFNIKKQVAADALLLADIKPGELIPEKGRSLTFVLNGEEKIIEGNYGPAAEIYINGVLGNIQTQLNPGDEIVVKPAGKGAPVAVYVKDIIEYYEDENVDVIVNGKPEDDDYLINDGDIVKVAAGDETNAPKTKHDDPVQEEIKSIDMPEEGENKIQHDTDEMNKEFKVNVNGREIIIAGSQKNYIFVDIFNFIDFDIKKSQGNIVLKLNGRNAAYTDIIGEGDVIEIYWGNC